MENEKEKLSSGKNLRPKGRWTINQKKCTTCCECVDACLMGLLYFEETKNLIFIRNEGRGCTQCGDCASACAYGAIVLT